jgi:hypothetical protein
MRNSCKDELKRKSEEKFEENGGLPRLAYDVETLWK